MTAAWGVTGWRDREGFFSRHQLEGFTQRPFENMCSFIQEAAPPVLNFIENL